MRSAFALGWLALLASLGSVCGVTLYVSPAGNDAWSGRLPTANAARDDGPLASLPKAQAAARAARDQGSVTVVLADGTYTLDQPLTFTPEDSGTAAAPMVWRAAEGARPVISGGRRIEGWRESVEAGQRRWTATLPEVAAGAWTFRQLFVSADGGPYERRYRPHLGMLAVDKLTYSPRRQAAPHRAAQKDFVYYRGDLKPWRNLDDVELVALHMWSSSRLRIARLDETNRIVEFTGLPTFAIGQVGPHNPYYVENVAEALDEPGEWYLERPTGRLTYLPLPGETPARTRLVAPRLSRVLSLEGDWAKGRFVEHLTFERLTFAHGETPLPREGYGGSQAQPDLPATVEAVGARGCRFERCTIAQTGNYGLSLGRGCADNRVSGCRLFDLGGGGIKVGDIGMAANAAAPELPVGNRIENCAISDGGLMYCSANAIWAGIVRDTIIAHNAIWNFPYSGIAVGWNWSDQPTACGGNRIEANRIHHVVALLADGASIYTLGRQPGTVIRGNVVCDNPQGPHAREHWQLGLYLDEGSSEMVVENNLAYNVGTHGFNINGGARNVVRNNIFGPVHGDNAPFVRSYAKPYTTANVFEHNLCYTGSTNLADALWPTTQMACRANLWFNRAGRPLSFAGKTFEQWQALGQDAGSVNVDPRFVDPDQGDFTLRPGSPALALGFLPFDPKLAGPIAAYADVAAPVKVTPPPVYAMKPAVIPPEPLGFRLSLEDVPVGVVPRELSASTADGHQNEVGVVEGIAAAGTRSLKITDAPLTARSFLPYLSHTLARPVTAGTVTLTSRFRQEPGAPCGLSFEFRDYQPRSGREFAGGPNAQITGDGTLSAGGQTLGQLKPGEWLTLRIRYTLGQPAARRASVVAIWPDGRHAEAEVPLGDDFQTLSRVMLIGIGNVAGSCYLDDLSLTVE